MWGVRKSPPRKALKSPHKSSLHKAVSFFFKHWPLQTFKYKGGVKEVFRLINMRAKKQLKTSSDRIFA